METANENLSNVHIVHTLINQFIQCYRLNENDCEMSKNENRTCKARKTTVSHR